MRWEALIYFVFAGIFGALGSVLGHHHHYGYSLLSWLLAAVYFAASVVAERGLQPPSEGLRV